MRSCGMNWITSTISSLPCRSLSDWRHWHTNDLFEYTIRDALLESVLDLLKDLFHDLRHWHVVHLLKGARWSPLLGSVLDHLNGLHDLRLHVWAEWSPARRAKATYVNRPCYPQRFEAEGGVQSARQTFLSLSFPFSLSLSDSLTLCCHPTLGPLVLALGLAFGAQFRSFSWPYTPHTVFDIVFSKRSTTRSTSSRDKYCLVRYGRRCSEALPLQSPKFVFLFFVTMVVASPRR